MNAKIYTRNSLRLPKNLAKFHSKKRLKGLKLIAVLVIAISFAYFSIKAIDPIMEKQCKNMAKSIATKISNNECTKVMEGYSYNDMLNITKDKDGNVLMVETNIVTINKIISAIPLSIQEQMEKQENNTFSIRLGSFFGSNLFAGRGPNVNIKMELTGNLDTNLKSEFVDAGINQTLHRIYLEVICNIVILTPYNTIEDQIVNQVLLAEGVIVGNVPSSYYNLEGLNASDSMQIVK